MTIAKEEQLGLALSGGGFRASLFHLGGFWRLNESGKLAEVDAISAVSAGGLVAVILATRWGKLNFENQRATNFREEITEPVLQLCGRNLDVSSAIAGLVVGPIVLEKRFENLLVGKLTLGQLPSHPNFIFNACHLETESNWSFSRSGIDAGEMGIIQATDFPIAKLLAAACSLPPALPPVRIRLHSKLFSEGMLPDLDRGTVFKTATLADAGLCDGLGVQAIGHMKHLLVSDGTRSFKRAGIPPWEVWTSRITNPLHTALEQNRRLRLEQLETAIKPESTDGRREGQASWDEGAYQGESLGSMGTDVTRQRVFSSRTGLRERSGNAGNRVIVTLDAAGYARGAGGREFGGVGSVADSAVRTGAAGRAIGPGRG